MRLHALWGVLIMDCCFQTEADDQVPQLASGHQRRIAGHLPDEILGGAFPGERG